MQGLQEATRATAEAAALAKAEGWSVKRYRALKHRRGVAYEADLYLNGNKVGWVECQGIGDGAAARFDSTNKQAAKLFQECADKAFADTEFAFLADEFFVEAVLTASGK